jgi:HSP20 family protein
MFELSKRHRTHPFINVIKEFDDLGKGFDDLSHFFGVPTVQGLTSPGYIPPIELLEKENKYVISAELPGLEKNNVTIDLTDEDILLLKGEKQETKKENNEEIHFTEISYGSFRREIRLPSDIEKEKISASFKNGTIEISLPKTIKNKKTNKKIEIK